MMINPNDPNVAMLDRVAQLLGTDLCNTIVFVGGAAAGLLITDLAMPAIRRTDDVDVVSPVKKLDEFRQLEEQLRQRGFTPDQRPDAPICRWLMDDVTVDVMPSKEEIFGFSNRWYPLSIATAESHTLPSGIEIRVIRAPEFIATKIEAFYGRGQGDHLLSHDLGDVISVIDGRESLLTECQGSHRTLREYLALQFQTLLNTPAFLDALPGHLQPDPASQERLPHILNLMKMMAQMSAD